MIELTKKQKLARLAIRTCLTTVLLYFVYHETGAWTTLALFIIFVSNEVHNELTNIQTQTMDMVVSTIETLGGIKR